MYLTQLRPNDVGAIKRWPSYPGELSDLDYALRSGGWLDEFPESETNHRYGGWVEDELIGFSVLNETGHGKAEFYVAIHPDKVGLGFGKILTQLIIMKGFQELHLNTIYLRVRIWHKRAINVYERIGFRKLCEVDSNIHGRAVRVYVMEIHGS